MVPEFGGTGGGFEHLDDVVGEVASGAMGAAAARCGREIGDAGAAGHGRGRG